MPPDLPSNFLFPQVLSSELSYNMNSSNNVQMTDNTTLTADIASTSAPPTENCDPAANGTSPGDPCLVGRAGLVSLVFALPHCAKCLCLHNRKPALDSRFGSSESRASSSRRWKKKYRLFRLSWPIALRKMRCSSLKDLEQ